MRKRKQSLARDASRYGVGAVIIHATADEEYPIAFSSRKLKKSERNYLQIEETLAIFFGVRKFHKYLYERLFHLHPHNIHKTFVYSGSSSQNATQPECNVGQ